VLGDAVGVGDGVPAEQLVVRRSVHPPLMLPTSTPASSRTYKDHVPFGFVPLNTDNNCGSVYGPAGAGAGKTSVVVS
jgi:hypothetical protein